MGFDRLPDRIGSVPDLVRPHVAPAPPVYDTTAAVQKGLAQVEKIIDYMSPFERHKRMIAGVQMQMQKKMLADYQKNPDKYTINAQGNIIPIGTKAAEMAYKAQMMSLKLTGQKLANEHKRNQIKASQPQPGSNEWVRQQSSPYFKTAPPGLPKPAPTEKRLSASVNYDNPFGNMILSEDDDISLDSDEDITVVDDSADNKEDE